MRAPAPVGHCPPRRPLATLGAVVACGLVTAVSTALSVADSPDLVCNLAVCFASRGLSKTATAEPNRGRRGAARRVTAALASRHDDVSQLLLAEEPAECTFTVAVIRNTRNVWKNSIRKQHTSLHTPPSFPLSWTDTAIEDLLMCDNDFCIRNQTISHVICREKLFFNGIYIMIRFLRICSSISLEYVC